MRSSLVWHKLAHEKLRTAVAVLGVSFAAVLMFMQLGFLGAVRSTATTILDALDFDVLLVSPAYLYLYDAKTFPKFRLDEARSVAGVREAVPLYVGFNSWSKAVREAGSPSSEGEQQRGIFVIGYDLSAPPFRDERVAGLSARVRPDQGGGCRALTRPEDLKDLEALRPPDTVLFDRLSQRDFGFDLFDPCPDERRGGWAGLWEGARTKPDPGRVQVMVGKRPVRVVGAFDLDIGFGADGAILVSDENFSRLYGGRSLDDVSLGLIRTAPGADPDEVAARLRRELAGDDVRVLTRAEVRDGEIQYWVWEQPIGMIFSSGLVIAAVVGVVFVYQILSSDITNHFGEFATLKAMGRTNAAVSWLVMEHALVLAHAGFVPGLALSALLGVLVRYATHMPVVTTRADALTVYAALCGVCMASAFLALGKVRRADPADLFA